jgi:hypothetical protein
MVTHTRGISDEFEDFVQPESEMQNEQQTNICKEIQNSKQQQSNWRIITTE